MTTSFTLPYWYDLHTHLRQGALLAPIVKSQLDMACAGVLGMPNTLPPTAKIHEADDLPYRSLESYYADVMAAGGDQFDDVILPLYITKDTSTAMIEAGAKSGLLRACKYYPPSGTTNAGFGYPIAELLKSDVFKALEDNDIVLCLHGEDHHMCGEDYFDRTKNAEEVFYKDSLPILLDRYKNLRIVCEHITTKVAADFVSSAPDTVRASVTPQHLLYTIGHLLQGLKYHLYCVPLLKFSEDRDALRKAVTDPNNTKFFAGTDSAAHTVKATPCGCAAGCFTGGIAPQLYAEAFELSGLDLSDPYAQKTFKRFLCDIGPEFYGLKTSDKTFTLTKTPQSVSLIDTPDGPITPLPVGLGKDSITWSLSI